MKQPNRTNKQKVNSTLVVEAAETASVFTSQHENNKLKAKLVPFVFLLFPLLEEFRKGTVCWIDGW
jgi:hypothetical protein